MRGFGFRWLALSAVLPGFSVYLPFVDTDSLKRKDDAYLVDPANENFLKLSSQPRLVSSILKALQAHAYLFQVLWVGLVELDTVCETLRGLVKGDSKACNPLDQLVTQLIRQAAPLLLLLENGNEKVLDQGPEAAKKMYHHSGHLKNCLICYDERSVDLGSKYPINTVLSFEAPWTKDLKQRRK